MRVTTGRGSIGSISQNKKDGFQEAGLHVEFVDANPDYLKSLDDMAAGKLDTHGFYLFDLMQYRVKGSDLVGVICSDMPVGNVGIAARPGIREVKDLAGKKVGVPKGTFLEYFLSRVLEQGNLHLEDVTLVDSVPENAVEDLSSATVDAVVTREPSLSDAVKAVKGTRLIDTSQILGIPLVVTAFHKSFIRSRPGDVQAFVNIWHRTTKFIREHPKEAFTIIAGIYNRTPGDVADFAQRDRIVGLEENMVLFTFSPDVESLYGASQRVSDFMLNEGITDRRLDGAEFLENEFIRRLYTEGA